MGGGADDCMQVVSPTADDAPQGTLRATALWSAQAGFLASV